MGDFFYEIYNLDQDKIYKTNDLSSVRNINKKVKNIINKNLKNNKHKKLIKKEVLGKIRCNIGNETEIDAIKIVEKQLNKKISNPLNGIRRYKTYGGVSFKLYGKTDGYIINDDLLIEVKNRTNGKIYNRYFPQELIQMYVYMLIFGKNKILFIEHCSGEVYTEIIERNEYYCNKWPESQHAWHA